MIDVAGICSIQQIAVGEHKVFFYRKLATRIFQINVFKLTRTLICFIQAHVDVINSRKNHPVCYCIRAIFIDFVNANTINQYFRGIQRLITTKFTLLIKTQGQIIIGIAILDDERFVIYNRIDVKITEAKIRKEHLVFVGLIQHTVVGKFKHQSINIAVFICVQSALQGNHGKTARFTKAFHHRTLAACRYVVCIIGYKGTRCVAEETQIDGAKFVCVNWIHEIVNEQAPLHRIRRRSKGNAVFLIITVQCIRKFAGVSLGITVEVRRGLSAVKELLRSIILYAFFIPCKGVHLYPTAIFVAEVLFFLNHEGGRFAFPEIGIGKRRQRTACFDLQLGYACKCRRTIEFNGQRMYQRPSIGNQAVIVRIQRFTINQNIFAQVVRV